MDLDGSFLLEVFCYRKGTRDDDIGIPHYHDKEFGSGGYMRTSYLNLELLKALTEVYYPIGYRIIES